MEQLQTVVYRISNSIYFLVLACYVASLGGCATFSASTQMNNQGLRYWNEGRFDLAEDTLQQALVVGERDLGPYSGGVGVILVNLGLVYTDQGRYAEAIDVFQRADPIIKRKYGEKDPTYAQFLNNIGYAFLRKGDYAEAKQEFEHSISIYDAAGATDTVSALNGLSMAFRETGDLATAENLAKRALDQVKSGELGWSHKGPVLQNLGTIYLERGFLDRAETTYVQVLEAREQRLGESHPETGRTVASLAELYIKLGKSEQAEELYKRAINIFERRLPAGHPDITQSLKQYAEFLRNTGRIDESLEVERRIQIQ